MKQEIQSNDNPLSPKDQEGWILRLNSRIKTWCDHLSSTQRKRLTFTALGLYLLIFILVITFTII